LTKSATVFWATTPGKINSKTFRVVSVLDEWFVSTAAQATAATKTR
jgi:hypothetical protein